MDQIKIGWKMYTIKQKDEIYDQQTGKECYGQIFYDEQIIYLRTGDSKATQEVTLIHEVLHGMEDVYGIELSEDLVNRLAHGLYTVVKDNCINLELEEIGNAKIK